MKSEDLGQIFYEINLKMILLLLCWFFPQKNFLTNICFFFSSQFWRELKYHGRFRHFIPFDSLSKNFCQSKYKTAFIPLDFFWSFNYQFITYCKVRLFGLLFSLREKSSVSISLLKSIFINAKILFLSYKISIFAITKIVLERRYLEMIAPFDSYPLLIMLELLLIYF